MSHSIRTAVAVLVFASFGAGCERGPSMVGELPITDPQPVGLGLSLSNESSAASVDTHVWIDGVEILAGPLDAGDRNVAPRPHHDYELAADRGEHVVEVTVDGERLRLTRELTFDEDTWLVLGVWDESEVSDSSVETLVDGDRQIHREPGLILGVQGFAPAYL